VKIHKLSGDDGAQAVFARLLEGARDLRDWNLLEYWAQYEISRGLKHAGVDSPQFEFPYWTGKPISKKLDPSHPQFGGKGADLSVFGVGWCELWELKQVRIANGAADPPASLEGPACDLRALLNLDWRKTLDRLGDEKHKWKHRAQSLQLIERAERNVPRVGVMLLLCGTGPNRDAVREGLQDRKELRDCKAELDCGKWGFHSESPDAEFAILSWCGEPSVPVRRPCPPRPPATTAPTQSSPCTRSRSCGTPGSRGLQTRTTNPHARTVTNRRSGNTTAVRVPSGSVPHPVSMAIT